VIKEMLRGVGVELSDTILLHSDLTAYWREDYSGSYSMSCANAYREIMDSVSALVVPTFNYDFSTSGKPYSHEKSPSQVGWFTNWCLFEEKMTRSFHPVFSFASTNSFLMDNVSKDAFGVDSVFDRLYKMNAKIVFLSVPATFATFVHYVEQKLNVWYRYKKYFTGQVSKGEETWTDTYSLYVRDLNKGVENNFEPLFQIWEKCGIIKSCAINDELYLKSVSCVDLFNVVRCAVVQNPNALITYKEN
jgi:aminoglycoside 3-N-acetyltransferase